MPPKKGKSKAEETPRTQRRSNRIASRANSEAASSVAPEDVKENVKNKSDILAKYGTASKRKPCKKVKTEESEEPLAPFCETEEEQFDVSAVIRQILRGNRAHIHTLTIDQKDEVINAFANRETQLREKLNEMAEEKQRLTEERDEAQSKKNAFRDRMFQHDMARRTFLAQQEKEKKAEEKAKQPASSTPPTTNTAADATASTPRAPSENDVDDSTHFNGADMSIVQNTPLSYTTVAHHAQTEPKPSSFFGSFFRTIASPFTTVRKSVPISATPLSPTKQKLGELPASRKRPAPAPEPETEPRQAVQPQQQPTRRRQPPTQTATAPSTPAAAQPHREPVSAASHFQHVEPTLGTITEYTEPTEDGIIVPDPTPSRPPPTRSTHTQPAPARHRDISTVRKQLAAKSRAATPSRAWDTKPTPREPNADRRLQKLRNFQELNQQLKIMKKDPEIEEMTERAMKRVKVDDLIAIPHNRPGDAESTFRVPEVDSEDEMEIDEEAVALRSNVFEADKEETPKSFWAPKKSLFANIAQKPQTQPAKEPTKDTALEKRPRPQQEIVEQRPPLNLQFPEIKRLPPGQENADNEQARIQFEYGFKMWQLNGTLVPGLFGC